MSRKCDVAIVGAGPYGLSLATHLEKKNIDFRIFGRPMGTWRCNMPQGMCLKSEGFACNIYHPDGLLTLEDFCRENAIPYAHIGVPVSLATFSSYGMAFQQRFVPSLTDTSIVNIRKEEAGFLLTLEEGDTILARRVVIAAGITHFAHLPPVLASLPADFVSHSVDYHSLERFQGKQVAVIGAGSSAVDVAGALHDAGAKPFLVTRRTHIPFHRKAPDKRSLMTRLRAPWSGLGPSWRSRLACELPGVFHHMPFQFRLKVVRKHLGPAPGWFMREKIVGNVPMHTEVSVTGAEVDNGKVLLRLASSKGEPLELTADHIIAGTGYRIDVRRLPFLGEELGAEIATEDGSPKLSRNFESSVTGLYFVGAAAALSFGPLLRFTFGGRFSARRITWHLTSELRAENRRLQNKWASRKNTSEAGTEVSR